MRSARPAVRWPVRRLADGGESAERQARNNHLMTMTKNLILYRLAVTSRLAHLWASGAGLLLISQQQEQETIFSSDDFLGRRRRRNDIKSD